MAANVIVPYNTILMNSCKFANHSAKQTVLFWVSLGDFNPNEGRLWLREPERCLLLMKRVSVSLPFTVAAPYWEIH